METSSSSSSLPSDNHGSLNAEKRTRKSREIETTQKISETTVLGDESNEENDKNIDENSPLNVAQKDDLPNVSQVSIVPKHAQLTEQYLAELACSPSAIAPVPNAIRAWAAELPEVPESVQPMTGQAHILELDPDTAHDRSNGAGQIHETKDVFTETQKIAYVGLCALTSLEVVHDYQGNDHTYARMSAGNWQRKLMRMIYTHMDISKEEIEMIETLSKHHILPTDLVHQFTAQGETKTVNLGDFHQVNEEQSSKDFIIDLRWTIMCDLFLLCLSSETYDARSRVFIARVAYYLSLDWFRVLSYEKRIAEHLLQNDPWETETVATFTTTQTNMEESTSVRNDAERLGRNKQRKKKRFVMIGLATLGGGLILGLSAGLMAPVIAGGIGAILTTVGVTGTSGFLGGTAGIALITGSATLAGSRLGAVSMNKRMKAINTFEFLPVHTDDHVNCIVTITGQVNAWLPNTDSNEEATTLPFSTLDPLMGDHFSLYWEPEMLVALGSAFKIFATEAVTFSIQQALAHTIMGALLAGLTWPLALTKLGYLVDNPWANGLDRARLAGLILADTIMNRNLGSRPVTLVGYSLGARVIFYCLLELARVNAYGLVENVALFGTPVSASKAQWRECTTVVSGRFINGYATNDWLLGFLFRASTAGLGNVAGLRPLQDIESNRVQNLDCTDLLKGHLNYRSAMPKLLKRAGFNVTSEDLPEQKEKEDAPTKELTVRNSTLSSLSSGKASIQFPSKQQPSSSSSTSSSSTSSFSSHSSTSSSKVMSRPDTPTVTPEHKPPSDMDIIADILANATAAAASKSGTYSSLSSGKASIARSRSDTLRSSTSESRFSLFGKKKPAEEEQDETHRQLKDVGIEIKEIQSTLGRLVVPDEVLNPMPKCTLEMPPHARINR
ncbi:hypothetical protein EC973_000573 [Apophysomyces ossiformis]|uniref:DUF726-domain-containing protein n=1 Tax=Apophysomyces ossiformis TaxID=679940 RepID=A0A8H7EN05_9FUNG|nr:hypothetical protein EC973_000573 [Apophysomyces ossiformis]